MLADIAELAEEIDLPAAKKAQAEAEAKMQKASDQEFLIAQAEAELNLARIVVASRI